ncbi:MAG TPA: hypothetical protein VFN21_11675, partial [Acidimicrobiales bacterium]|nr:hypothetical protein [Acidimicrobiales bacterium]
MTPLLGRTRDRLGPSKLDADEVRAAHACASWLIGYPDEALVARLGDIGRLAAGLDSCLAEPLGRTVDALAAEDPVTLCERYVETF